MLSDLTDSEREEYLSKYTIPVATHIVEHLRNRASTDVPHNCQSDEISR